jgi:ADP-dependent NAD(P)H-hydrate dehydratase / NAD(P)H-hydrate epimerase
MIAYSIQTPASPALPEPSPCFYGAARVPVLTADEMRAWDAGAIRGLGIPERVLMEAAGRAAAAVVHRLYPAGRVVAAVGRGNNGGDALVALRTLAAWGRDVAVVPVGGRPPDDPLLHGWSVEAVEPAAAERAFATAAVVLDGLLGTGARGAPRAPEAAAIRAMHAAGRPVVALDGPSGVDYTTGAVAGEAVRAAVTVAFGAPKRGLLRFPGRLHAGRIVAVEIGLPPLEACGAWLTTPASAAAALPPVPPDAHKGTVGKVLVVAGRKGMAGAAALAGMGALRAGAGMVVLASPEANREILQGLVPEALFVDRDALPDDLQDGVAAVAAGPALGTDAAAHALLERILRGGDAPLVLDADAVTLLGRSPGLRDAADRPLVLTPHPAEMARLMEMETAAVTADPFAVAEAAAARFGCAVLLKGAPSVVAAPGAAIRVSVAGHAGIATGGMGDVLTGTLAAFLARGVEPAAAAALALHLSGRAAQIAGRGRGLLPRDVAESLPAAMLEPFPAASPLGLPFVTLDLPAPA